MSSLSRLWLLTDCNWSFTTLMPGRFYILHILMMDWVDYLLRCPRPSSLKVGNLPLIYLSQKLVNNYLVTPRYKFILSYPHHQSLTLLQSESTETRYTSIPFCPYSPFKNVEYNQYINFECPVGEVFFIVVD